MTIVTIKQLADKLNPVMQETLQKALGLTGTRKHYKVEIEHWLHGVMNTDASDLQYIFQYFGVRPERLAEELTRSLDKMDRGNSKTATISSELFEVLQAAWPIASLKYGESKIRTAHVLMALLNDRTLRARTLDDLRELEKVQLDHLTSAYSEVTSPSVEAGTAVQLGEAAAAGDAHAAEAVAKAATGGAKPGGALAQFTVDLTADAKSGKIDNIVGRDREIREMVSVLSRRRQNNPILVGEAGVGKTAVVEGFAVRVAKGDVPPSLKGVVVRSLDLGLLQAGASLQGEFEQRLRGVIDEVESSPVPIIMFIDEAHTLIGAGGKEGQGDAANLLKPALARGQLRTIAATTWPEYAEYFEKDAALSRRFQPISVDEPDEQTAMRMLRCLVATLEKHHSVRILEEAVEDAVKLSARYIPARQLPDKCVSVLDTACARVRLSQTATPDRIEDTQRTIDLLEVEIRIREREVGTSGIEDKKLQDLIAEKDAAETELETLTARRDEELALIQDVLDLRAKVEAALGSEHAVEDGEAPAAAEGETGDLETLRAEYKAAREKLTALQGEAPLIHDAVDANAVAEVVAEWTGIPVNKMASDEIRMVLGLEDQLKNRIIGQTHAIETISRVVRNSRAKLRDETRPVGVFLLVGTSGVGKTETALALSDIVYGGEQNMTTINMSEFKDESKIQGLLGAPPGYVGYGKGGVLTEAVRRKPHSVVLLDEIEKAHKSFQDLFYQVFDKGTAMDGTGRIIDFKNTVIMLTSNAGTDTLHKLCKDPDTMPEPEALREALMDDLLKEFAPAFLGRCIIIPIYPLVEDELKAIARLQIGRLVKRAKANHDAALTYSDAVLNTIVERCKEVETGARNIQRILANDVMPRIASGLLERMADGTETQTIALDVDDTGIFQVQFS